ncbi:MAG TPA: thiamine-phosphate kinase [Acidobacteriaceae bacterium]|nr:thiamine-phosphate kinase [Acidobacteriaceae bacterium]
MGEREREIVTGIRARALRGGSRGSALRVGIGDDAAVLAVRRGEELVVTTDFSLEDVHFRRGWHAPEAVGHKCLARGLSDIAAMGARPVAAFVSLAVPAELTRKRAEARSWVDRFYDGLLALAGRWQVPLAGGDLAQAPGGAHARVAADIVVVGAVERGRALLRSGAKAGDAIYVTGTLGGAAAELRALMKAPARFRGVTAATAEHPHFFPEPRIDVGRALMRRGLATAAIDISDGLSVDLEHLCEESGLRAEVDASLLPLGLSATLEDALHGGDDYELLFTADAEARVPRKIAGVPVHRIGRILLRLAGRPRMTLLEDGGRRPLQAAGWQHF